MGYKNLNPVLQRIQMVSGFIASQGQRTDAVFEIHSCKPLIGIKWEEGWEKQVPAGVRNWESRR
jgi:ubiquinone biosynthesis protein Coq4